MLSSKYLSKVVINNENIFRIIQKLTLKIVIMLPYSIRNKPASTSEHSSTFSKENVCKNPILIPYMLNSKGRTQLMEESLPRTQQKMCSLTLHRFKGAQRDGRLRSGIFTSSQRHQRCNTAKSETQLFSTGLTQREFSSYDSCVHCC